MTFASESSLKTMQTGLLYFENEFGSKKPGRDLRVGVHQRAADAGHVSGAQQGRHRGHDRRRRERMMGDVL